MPVMGDSLLRRAGFSIIEIPGSAWVPATGSSILSAAPKEDLMVMPVGRTYRAMDETRGQSVGEAQMADAGTCTLGPNPHQHGAESCGWRGLGWPHLLIRIEVMVNPTAAGSNGYGSASCQRTILCHLLVICGSPPVLLSL